MKISLLDLQGNQDNKVNRETLAEYNRLLENPDLLGRLYRIFVYKNTHSKLWKEQKDAYVERNSDLGPKWVNDINTNLERTLFTHDTVTWSKFLEGLVILAPAFDKLTLDVFSSLNDGKVTSLVICNSSLTLNDAKIAPLPKGEELIPKGFYRSPLEPLPLKVVRDAIAPIGSSAEFRKIVRENLKGTVHSSKLSSSVNSLYVSVLKSEMSWKRMTAILFALGATQLMVSIKGTKNGKVYKSIAQVSR